MELETEVWRRKAKELEERVRFLEGLLEEKHGKECPSCQAKNLRIRELEETVEKLRAELGISKLADEVVDKGLEEMRQHVREYLRTIQELKEENEKLKEKIREIEGKDKRFKLLSAVLLLLIAGLIVAGILRV